MRAIANYFAAKPGFGKTCLSLTIIEDLAETVLSSGDAPTVAYFHFDQQKKSRTNSTDEALRAIAEQLIHSHRRSRISLDALALIETDSGSGQYTSSRSDIRLAIDIL